MLYFHRCQKQLIRKIPHGFLIGKSLCDGNCLYNCLFGDETKAHALRLQSVLSAVRHFDFYVEKVRDIIIIITISSYIMIIHFLLSVKII